MQVVARFRLRFLLQEFDLSGPEVVIGRSPECHISIEDPLISRRHARVTIKDETAWVADLGSRNGVRVNGRLIKGEHQLADGDRLRLGTQEMLFSAVGKAERPPRPTGHMRLCHSCGTPYAEVATSCPACGTPAPADEDTISGQIVEPRRSWTFQLLSEVVDRALGAGRAIEAERLMRRAAKEIDERLAVGDALDAMQVGMVSTYAVRLARLVGSAEWIAWGLALHRRHNWMVPEEMVDRIEELDRVAFPDLPALLDAYTGWYRAQLANTRRTAHELDRLARLERVARR